MCKKVKNLQNVVLQKTTKSRYLLNFENILNALNYFSNNVQNWESKKQAAVRDMSYKISLNFI